MYKRIILTTLTDPFWYLITFPADLIRLLIWCLIRKRKLKKYWELKGVLNEIRKYLHTFDEVKNTKYGKERIEVFKAYYKLEQGVIFMKFKINHRSSAATDLKRFREGLVVLTGYSASEIINEKRWNMLILFDEIEPITQLKHKPGRVGIGTGVCGLIEWHYDQYPHALIVGETGTGKSNMIRYLLNNLFTGKLLLWAVDGKGVDLKAYVDFFEAYASVLNIDDVIQLIEAANTEMMRRMQLLAENNVDNYRKNSDLLPLFVIVDEMSSIIKKVELLKGTKEATRLRSIIGDIVRAGRAAGVQMIFAMQRADTKFVDGEMRDNLQLRIVLGAASDVSYDMCFDRHDFKKQSIGRGWYKQGNELSVIAVPLVKNVVRDTKKSNG